MPHVMWNIINQCVEKRKQKSIITSVNCTGGAALQRHGGHHGPHEAPPWGAMGAPWGPIWGGNGPPGAPMGPLGPYGADLAPSPPGQLRRSSQGRFFSPRKPLFGIFGPKNGQQKVEIEGAGPPRLDPQWNSVPGPASDVKNGGMATHLVTNLGDLGSVGVPGLARTPLAWPVLAWPGLAWRRRSGGRSGGLWGG